MMRVTTRMLDETARKTGIPINRTSLLSYLDQTESSGNALLDALNKNNKVSSAASADSKKLEKTADKLQASAEKLTADKDKSLFDKARESGDNEELYASVKSFLDDYNSTLSALKTAASPMNVYYGQMLQKAAEENSSSLESIGITIAKDGKLILDEEKLKSAAVDDIEKVFGTSGTLPAKASFIAGRISENAQASVQSLSGHYDIFGKMYSQNASKYDFWG